MERKHLGARSELIACAWLLERGYEVFRNVSQHGHIDLIAIKGPKIFYIDVKTNRPNKSGYLRQTLPPKELIYLLVDLKGECTTLPTNAL